MMAELVAVLVVGAGARAEPCVLLRSAPNAPITRRVRDELRVTLALPVHMATSNVEQSPCATLVELDEPGHRFMVLVSSSQGPLVLTDTLDGSEAISASHVAEVVRGALIEVAARGKAKQPPPVQPVPPTAVAVAPAAVAPVDVASVVVTTAPEKPGSRAGLGLSFGPLVSAGGATPGLLLQADGRLWLSRLLGLNVTASGPLLASATTVPEGTISVHPWAALLTVCVRWWLSTSWQLMVGAGAGAWWLHVTSRAQPPYVGTTADRVLVALTADVRLGWQVVGPLVVVLGASAHTTGARLALDVQRRTVGSFGVPMGTARLGLELSW